MQFFEDMVGKLNAVVFPNTEAGFSATVREYRDDIGKIVKVVIDIIPTAVESAAGPTAGLAASVTQYGIKGARALYNFLTTPVSQKKVEELRQEPSAQASAQAGALVLKTAMKLTKQEKTQQARRKSHTKGKRTIPQQSGPLARRASVQAIAEQALRTGVKEGVKAAPEIVVRLCLGSQSPIVSFLNWGQLAHSFSQLKDALGGLLNTRKLNQAANAAIALIQEEDRTHRKKTKKIRASSVSSQQAIKRIIQHKEDAKKQPSVQSPFKKKR